jgi:phosphoribosyl-AMP cyclohydrolase
VQVIEELKFDTQGLIPAIIQEVGTNEILMVAYMDKEAVQKTLETGRTWFWSRSRRQYWCKGETSGHIQKVKNVRYDCDADALLVLVEQVGVACHTGHKSCFFRSIDETTGEGVEIAEPEVEM